VSEKRKEGEGREGKRSGVVVSGGRGKIHGDIGDGSCGVHGECSGGGDYSGSNSDDVKWRDK
jgi:hypothetical protein